MYWGKATQIPTVAEVMPVNHFDKTKQCFHCNDNSKHLPNTHKDFDKTFKVRPVLDSVRAKCQQLPQEENHSVHEQIIPTKTRTSLKQYLPNKPYKWGIKVWARCGVSGILYDFEVHTGKTTKADRSHNEPFEKNWVWGCGNHPQRPFKGGRQAFPLRKRVNEERTWVLWFCSWGQLRGHSYLLVWQWSSTTSFQLCWEWSCCASMMSVQEGRAFHQHR